MALALKAFRREAEGVAPGATPALPGLALPSTRPGRGQAAQASAGFLRRANRWAGWGILSQAMVPILSDLSGILAAGTYAHLEFALRDLGRDYPDGRSVPAAKVPALEKALRALHSTYLEQSRRSDAPREPETDPVVVLSETFVGKKEP